MDKEVSRENTGCITIGCAVPGVPPMSFLSFSFLIDGKSTDFCAEPRKNFATASVSKENLFRFDKGFQNYIENSLNFLENLDQGKDMKPSHRESY